ncbi:hypothetical protein GALMADRAFT_215170 [Galerina marginata CBS 339.88]|uniref:Uncharacterized protein n=1 Tax=Galerina marginata (strain CBS 339.88) TaxID=685588 RepID=A0A067SF48_GALM3|nr:hypothetical protein GALMADRAFT_215170 [Galerina marginata CBS 339.88]
MADTKSKPALVLRLQTHRPDVRDIQPYTFHGCFAYLAAWTPFLLGNKTPFRHDLGFNKSRRARHSYLVRGVDWLQTLLFFIQTALYRLRHHMIRGASGQAGARRVRPLEFSSVVTWTTQSIGDGTVMRDRRIVSDSDHPGHRKVDLTNVLVNIYEAQSSRLSCLGIAYVRFSYLCSDKMLTVDAVLDPMMAITLELMQTGKP